MHVLQYIYDYETQAIIFLAETGFLQKQKVKG